jgi:hypothetical protein
MDALQQLDLLCAELGLPPALPRKAAPPLPRASRTRRVFTSVHGDNAALMERVAALYFRPGYRIADVTFGKGVFWRRIDTTQYDFYPSDLKTCPEVSYDFRHLPYPDNWCDVVVLDPPYVHGEGAPGFESCYRNSETKGVGHEGIIRLYEQGMTEATRILRRNGLLLVKCQDEVASGRQRWSHIEVYEIARRLGVIAQDLFVLVGRYVPPSRWKHQLHARKNHSYLWVFKKSG